MMSKTRSRFVRRLLRRVLVLAVLLLALGAAFARYHDARRAAVYDRLGIPGTLVDVGGRLMHVLQRGREFKGKRPTVVLEAGWGGMSLAWQHVLDQVGAFAHVVAYDRAGHGFSDDHGGAHDAVAVARDLRRLLAVIQVDGPVVLVGHSLGGPYARTFAGMFPEAVAGLLLVDASHPDQIERSAPLRRAMASHATLVRLIPFLAGTGLLRVLDVQGLGDQGLTGAVRELALEVAADPRHLSAARDEFEHWSISMQQTRDAGQLPGLPVRIVTAGHDAFDGAFTELQREFLQLGTGATQEVVADANHLSIVLDARHARRITAAVESLLEVVD